MRDRTTFPQLRYHEIFAGEEHGHQIYQPELNLRLSVRLQEKRTRTGKDVYKRQIQDVIDFKGDYKEYATGTDERVQDHGITTVSYTHLRQRS